jgi:2-(3-amino-3-carboxypropyl)histidine synthase
MRNFDFEEERMKQEILKLEAKRVLLQLPEGLKPEAFRLAKIVEKTGALAIVSADPCYGACDLATAEAESLGVDLIVHFGHARLVRYERVPTIYIEARATVNVEEAVGKALSLLKKWHRIGLATTVQHVQALDTVRELLLKDGKTVAIGDAGRLTYAGQVIGCDYSNVKSVAKNVDAFLFVGGGKFHALGVALSTMKPTVVADPYEGRGFSVDDEAQKIVRQRWASIEQASEARSFAIVVGLKLGQRRFEQALQVKQKLEEKGKSVCLLAANEIVPEVLNEFPSVEVYVNTACPRVCLDDASRFRKPVLTVDDALVVVGELNWEELCRRGLLEG